jgi:hypothetical protein
MLPLLPGSTWEIETMKISLKVAVLTLLAIAVPSGAYAAKL